MQFAPQSAYYHAKQSCYLCGRTDHLVDTGVQIEGEGVLAICAGCVKGDMLHTLGIDLDALELAAASVKEMEGELILERAGLREANRKVRDLKKALREATAEPVLI